PAVGEAIELSLRDRLGAMERLVCDSNHLRAFALMVAMMFTSFLIGPYVAPFLVANVGLAQSELKFIYLVGGLATILTMTPVGWLADRYGKLSLFRVTAVLTLIPTVLITVLPHG